MWQHPVTVDFGIPHPISSALLAPCHYRNNAVWVGSVLRYGSKGKSQTSELPV